MDASAKWLTSDYHAAQIIFLTRVVNLVFAIVLALRAGGLITLATRRPWAHLVRSVIALGMIFTFTLALSAMPLPDAIAIAFAAPLFMTILSIPILGERVGPRRWTAILVGFIGVLIVVKPSDGVLQWGALLALASAALYALMLTLGRRMSTTESSHTVIFYVAVVSLIITGVPLPWVWVTPPWEDLVLFLIVGLVSSGGGFLMTQAFRYGQVSLLAPLEYLALIWAVIFGFLFWNHVPDWSVFAGVTLLVGSGLYIAHRETRLARRRQSVPEAA
jgi:drug/metabolite transporter (DMT)-like permease